LPKLKASIRFSFEMTAARRARGRGHRACMEKKADF
jgi:hypothetical protein